MSASHREEGVLDWDAARKNVGHDAELLKTLMQMFVEECPAMLAGIRQAVETSDADALRRTAHMLKGSATIFAAQPVVEAAMNLEQMGREKNLAHVRQEFECLESRTARLLAIFQASAHGEPVPPHDTQG